MKNKKLAALIALLCTLVAASGTVYAAHSLKNATFAGQPAENDKTAVTEVAETEEAEEKPTEVAIVPEKEAEDTATADENVELESVMLNGALREYFGLDDGEPLTDELLATVTNITFKRSVFDGNLPEEYADKTAVACIVNGGLLTGAELPEVVSSEMPYEVSYEVIPTIVRSKYFTADAISDDWNSVKAQSFYITRDVNDPLLEPEGVEAMKQISPNSAVDAIVVIDPYAKDRELAELAQIFAENELLNLDTLIDGTVIEIPKEDIMKLPSLETIDCADDLTIEHVG